jgi:hypothetical protein
MWLLVDGLVEVDDVEWMKRKVGRSGRGVLFVLSGASE